MTSAAPDRPRIAYLVSQYPKLSHSFVASEIDGVRAAGVHVDTYTVRPWDTADLRTDADRAEAKATTCLIATVKRDPLALVRFAARRPDVLARGVWEALRFCAPAVRRRSLFYLLEAMVLVDLLSRRGTRHVHVHLSNNAADVAHLAVTMGRLLDGHRWTWSLAVHGPNELTDVSTFNLARKASAATFVACITDYCRSQVMTLLPPARWPDLHVIRMGIDPDLFSAVERPDRDDGPLRVLFVGRLVAEKAPQLLVQALAALDRGAAVARIVGGGELAAELADLIDRHGLQEQIELAGPVAQRDLPAHYAWADVFCLPSFAEGLPVVIMEAMATGLPVISTRIAGIPELVVDGRSGVLVAPGNLSALVAALSDLRDLAVRQRLAVEGRVLVRRSHTARDNAHSLATILGETLSAPH